MRGDQSEDSAKQWSDRTGFVNCVRGCEQRTFDICAAVDSGKICVKFENEEYGRSDEEKAS